MSTTEGNGGGAPAEVPAGEASPETLRRLEAALPHREASTPPPTEGAGRAVERNAVLLLALVALGIALGVVSVLALVL